MSAGLLKGLGAGLATAGDFMMRTKADELKEQRLRQYQLEAEARQNAREDTKDAEKLAREEAKAITRTEYEKNANGDTIKYGYNSDGEIVAQEEVLPEKSKGFAASRWGILNKDTGEYQMVAPPSGSKQSAAKLDPMVKAQIDSLNSDIKALRSSGDPDEDKLRQLEQQRNKLLGLESDNGGGSPGDDAAFLAAFQNKARNAKLDGAMVSTEKREPFNEFPGSLSDQVQKGPGLLQKAGDALSNFTKNQSAREVEGAKVFLDMVGRQISEGNANRSMVENLNSIYTNDALPPELRRKALELYKKANER